MMPVVAALAHDDQRRLPSILAWLASQTWIAVSQRRLGVVVVLNNCLAEPYEAVVAAAAAQYLTLDIEPITVVFDRANTHIRAARRLAMETAYDRCTSPERAAILRTDADAVPFDTRVSVNIRHLAEGVDLVSGLIIRDEAEENQLGPEFRQRAKLYQRYGCAVDRLTARIDLIRHDPWPRHHNHTGAGIEVWADIYRSVGGMPALPFREDVESFDGVRALGCCIRHSMDLVVTVSCGRRVETPQKRRLNLPRFSAAAGLPSSPRKFIELSA